MAYARVVKNRVFSSLFGSARRNGKKPGFSVSQCVECVGCVISNPVASELLAEIRRRRRAHWEHPEFANISYKIGMLPIGTYALTKK